MGLTILLITFIVLATLLVIFLGKQAKKMSDAYIDSFNFTQVSRPTFIRINDDDENDLIINADEIGEILPINRNDGKYIIRICLKGNQDSDIDFVYKNEIDRDSIYYGLYDYNADSKINE